MYLLELCRPKFVLNRYWAIHEEKDYWLLYRFVHDQWIPIKRHDTLESCIEHLLSVANKSAPLSDRLEDELTKFLIHLEKKKDTNHIHGHGTG